VLLSLNKHLVFSIKGFLRRIPQNLLRTFPASGATLWDSDKLGLRRSGAARNEGLDLARPRPYISSSMNASASISVRGRPREFCVDQALSNALSVFWRKGFEGTSLTDLTDAMGITRPSLYAAFGNKEALFRKALDLYERDKLAYMSAALDAPTARGVAERLLRGALDMQTSGSDPKGCLGVISSVACGAEAESIKAEVVARKVSSDAALLRRMEQAKRDGDLPDHIEPVGLVRYLTAVIQGLCLQAGSGTPIDELRRLVETTLELWPGR
jgi:AcrR family transcriptional regulator